MLFVPDCHHPYVDERAWNLVLKMGRKFKPDIVAVLGDFMDCAPVSSHSKDKSRLFRFKDEVRAGRVALNQLEKLGASLNLFIEGNHENRIERYLQEHAEELCDFEELKTPALLRLKETGWEFTPYKSHARVGQIYMTHDTGTAGATAHSRALNDFQDNCVIGHTHRMAVSYVGNAKGKPHVGAMFGWLGDVRRVDYMHSVKANRDWMLGFGVGYMEPSGVVHVQAVPIINYRCVVDGRLFRG